MFTLVDLCRPDHEEQLGFSPHSGAAKGLLLGGKSSLVLVPEHPEVRKLQSFFECTIFDNINTFYIESSNYVLDKDISEREEILIELEKRLSELNGNKPAKFTYYNYNYYARNWVKRINYNLEITVDKPEFSEYHDTKAIFHRSASNPDIPSPIELITDIKVPAGYYGNTTNSLRTAYELLRDKKVANILAKPLKGAGGKGITEIKHVDEIETLDLSGGYLLTEKLDLAYDPLGNEFNYAFAYQDGKLFGSPWHQMLKGYEYSGSISPFIENDHHLHQLCFQAQMFLDLVRGMGFRSMGGIDFLISDDVPYLVDNNLGRMTATHVPLFFQTRFARDVPFVFFKLSDKDSDVFTIWERLKSSGIAFDKQTRTGVYPLICMEGMFPRMIALNTTAMQAYALYQRTLEVLS